MSNKPVSIQITYADGSTREAGLNDVSESLQQELIRLKLMDPSGGGGDDGKYILIEWADGWREVFSVPETVTDLRKYYVIRREEKIGRLFMDKKETYPELLEIQRKPDEVKKVSLI